MVNPKISGLHYPSLASMSTTKQEAKEFEKNLT